MYDIIYSPQAKDDFSPCNVLSLLLSEKRQHSLKN